MNEQTFIETLSRVHGTRPFGADAEIVPFGGTNLLVSTDSFSEREDFLSGLEPETRGRVMAYGAIADILACGTKPVFPVNYDNCHLMNARNEALCQRAKGEEEQPSPSILLHGGTGGEASGCCPRKETSESARLTLNAWHDNILP